MLARARAFALRDGFSDCLKGVRSVEEESDILLANEADTPTPVPQSAKARRTRRASAAEIIEAETTDSSAGVLPPTTEAAPSEAQLVESEADEAEDFLKAS